MERFQLALAQLTPTLFDKQANLALAEQAIRRAASVGAAAILFPELFLTGYSLGGRGLEVAELDHGPSVQRVAELAGLHHIAVLMGYAELNPDRRHAHDAVFVVDLKGTSRAPIARRTFSTPRLDGSYPVISPSSSILASAGSAS